ncbi:MAG: Gfo/Idh/MocA family oxidoreductase [Planctomycetes bacterium]|nr:Gfo/Idh/MocA family oxidoreductase [Planctomycetota bacterium]
MKLRWGVIGAGGIADRRTIPEGIMPAKNAKLVAVMDADRKRTDEVAAKYGKVKAYYDSSDLLADKEVDALYVAIPTYMHCPAVLKAAKAGKHVLCEKPMAMNVAEARRMIAACKKAKVKLGLGYMMRFHPHHVALKAMVEQKKLGKLVMGRGELTCWYPKIKGAWRQDPKRGGGGSFVDMASHCVDVLEMFFGKVKRVTAFTNSVVQKYPVEDTAIATLEFRSGALGMVDALFNVPDEAGVCALEVYGTLGSVVASGTIGQSSAGDMTARLIDKPKGYAAAQTRAGAVKTFKVKPKPRNIYRAQIEEFSKAVLENKRPPVPGEDGLWNLKVCLAAYKSAKTGKAVSVR